MAPLQPDKVDDAVFEAEWKMTKSEEVGFLTPHIRTRKHGN